MKEFLKSLFAVMGVLLVGEIFLGPMVALSFPSFQVHILMILQWPAVFVLLVYFEVALLARGGRLGRPLIEGPLAGLLAGLIYSWRLLARSGGEGGLVASSILPLVAVTGLFAGLPVGLVYHLAGRGLLSAPPERKGRGEDL